MWTAAQNSTPNHRKWKAAFPGCHLSSVFVNKQRGIVHTDLKKHRFLMESIIGNYKANLKQFKKKKNKMKIHQEKKKPRNIKTYLLSSNLQLEA